MNAERTETAYRTLLVYAQYKDQRDEDMETNMTDLVTDLRHLADEYGIDFYDLLDRTYMHYSAERVR